MRHRDSVGNVGLLEPGSVQWMTAGRGIIHSEMPEQEAGRMAGFQLWVNLAAKDKMQAPAYRDVAPADVPQFDTAEGATVRAVINNLEQQHPGIKDRLLDEKGIRRFVNLYLGDEDVRFLEGLETKLKSGDELSIIPAIAGG